MREGRWSALQTKSKSEEWSRRTDLSTISQGSSVNRDEVASFPSPVSRHTKPSAASAAALTGSSPAAESGITGPSSGSCIRAMFT